MSTFFTDPHLPQNMCQGPLGSVVPAYAAHLSQQGYTQQSALLQLRFLADLNQWLHRQRLQVTDLTESMLHRYLRSRHLRFRPRRDDNSILRKLLHLLHDQGLLPKRSPPPLDNPRQRVEHDFDRYRLKSAGFPWPPASITGLSFNGFCQPNLVPSLFGSLLCMPKT